MKVSGLGFRVYRNCIGFGSQKISTESFDRNVLTESFDRNILTESFDRNVLTETFCFLELCFSFLGGGRGGGGVVGFGGQFWALEVNWALGANFGLWSQFWALGANLGLWGFGGQFWANILTEKF